MKSTKKKKKLLAAAAALALLAAVAGTFAWQTYQDQKLNRVTSSAVDDDSVYVNENWAPAPITPGGSATKEVAITNVSDTQVFVRVSFEEVMKHLKSKGVQSDVLTTTTYNPATATLTSNVPVAFNGDLYTAPTSGWSDITSQVTGVPTPSLPAGYTSHAVKVYAKGNATANPVTPSQIDVSYEAVVFYEYVIGSDTYYQKATFDVTQTGNPTSGEVITGSNWAFTGSNFKFYEYSGGYNYITTNWAESAQASPYDTSMTPVANGFALLSFDGNNNGNAFDYTTTATGLGVSHILPTAPSLLATADIPTASGDMVTAQAENHADFGSNPIAGIEIEFDAVTDISTMAGDSWVYNPDDGWFYYTEKLDASYTNSASVAGTTNQLIKKLHYSTGGIDQRFDSTIYDLIVKMEAVQGNITAVEDNTGFNFGPGGVYTPNTQAIYNMLNSL